ncbi:MBL fold metallo-hydrolase [Halomonas sp. KAO]|uniref:MBL fold metallo-hydrolase n=1 Tax=unclassified Halomonas TaxID=2609666 RepID=UPI00189CA0C1|nr:MULTISPECIES: MBL fold metallo-hydrolase [unclassified Halomonas]MBF7053951.1 MBL fold metallo-hydrolase [Halomonas sp. KAO]MDT0501833.1 MBL fold metallo-hydrolase [Halomonas sp. PAR7]MDT0511863.1 MBL fold metallo-hydrolase [Halomonas sp. LES1]MDT0592949.1 MBL fold metallo-hydrolase [Halomonas sp. PAR8]
MTEAGNTIARQGGRLHFASLGSGSKGNATLVSDGETHLLVDCGFTLREAERRLARLGLHPRQLDALLVTHEHGDHIRGVGPLARRYGVPVWLTPGTWGSGRLGELPERHWITPQARFAVKGLHIDPVTVPHDAREPVQFRIQGGERHLGLLTDLGHPTEHVAQAFAGCDALVLECNHDVRMLAEGPYPPRLKRRVGGDWGHLANTQAATLLTRLGLDRLQRIACSHLSEHNNRPELALEALTPLLDGDTSRLMVACQDDGLAWQAIA